MSLEVLQIFHLLVRSAKLESPQIAVKRWKVRSSIVQREDTLRGKPFHV